MKRLAILGSTGTIGVQTLEVIKTHPDSFEVVGMAAGHNVERLQAQIEAFRPKRVSVATELLALTLKKKFPHLEIMFGSEGLRAVAADERVDCVVSALVGARGIMPTLAAIEAKKDILLANKEVLVAAGPLVMDAIYRRNVALYPIDSEHNAIFQMVGNLDAAKRATIRHITLTASGGPFLHRPVETFSGIHPEEALRHPRWEMGPRITIDSATLMNKGFEVIEAAWLFGLERGKIEVAIHPQSIVHGLVSYYDGNTMACLSVPDMRAPIAYALAVEAGMHRLPSEVSSLDLTKVKSLTFEPPNFQKFPLLKTAFDAMGQGGIYPCLLNAADEIAVEAFLTGQILFTHISGVVDQTLSNYKGTLPLSIEGIMAADEWARQEAKQTIKLLS